MHVRMPSNLSLACWRLWNACRNAIHPPTSLQQFTHAFRRSLKSFLKNVFDSTQFLLDPVYNREKKISERCYFWPPCQLPSLTTKNQRVSAMMRQKAHSAWLNIDSATTCRIWWSTQYFMSFHSRKKHAVVMLYSLASDRFLILYTR